MRVNISKGIKIMELILELNIVTPAKIWSCKVSIKMFQNKCNFKDKILLVLILDV